MSDLIDVMAHLRPDVNVLDYPEAQPALLQFLAEHRQAIALPGESFGVTNKVTHHIALQPDAQPFYVPSYWLPHIQKQVDQQKFDELLQEGVIQESHSPWNSPLFFVPKKDGSYRPVIDFCKVNALTVPDHYPQLSLVFQKLTQTGPKAKFTICEFLNSRIEFLDTSSMEMAFTQSIEKSLLLRTSLLPSPWRMFVFSLVLQATTEPLSRAAPLLLIL